MSNGPIPPQVDPRKLADRGSTLEGGMSLASFVRLCGSLADNAGTAHVKLDFERDERKAVVIHSQLEVEVQMTCQRCLEQIALPIRSECHYAVVKGDANTQALPKGYDVLEVGDDLLDLLALVEDELLLALPIVPVHDAGVCQPPAGPNQSEPSADEVSRSSPFSVLAQLKRAPNV